MSGEIGARESSGNLPARNEGGGVIKPIETIYKGYRFRSRLEARWAVFFDALNIRWEYEKEGWDINGKWYLPDFYLPELDLWIEVKPGIANEWPSDKIYNLLCKLWEENNYEIPFNIIWLKGTPGYRDEQYSAYDWPYNGYVLGDSCYLWCECPKCGKIGMQFDGRAARICGGKCFPDSDKEYNTNTSRLISAYLKAQQARFEHGEKVE